MTDRELLAALYRECSEGGTQHLPEVMIVPGESLNTLTESDDYEPDQLYAVTVHGIELFDGAYES